MLKYFSGINLLNKSLLYLAKFSGRYHLNSSCFGTVRDLFKSAYSLYSVSETSLSLSVSSLRFFEGFSLAASVPENPDGCTYTSGLTVDFVTVELSLLNPNKV